MNYRMIKKLIDACDIPEDKSPAERLEQADQCFGLVMEVMKYREQVSKLRELKLPGLQPVPILVMVDSSSGEEVIVPMDVIERCVELSDRFDKIIKEEAQDGF